MQALEKKSYFGLQNKRMRQSRQLPGGDSIVAKPERAYRFLNVSLTFCPKLQTMLRGNRERLYDMKRLFATAVSAVLFSAVAGLAPAEAGGYRYRDRAAVETDGVHPKSSYYRGRSEVRGYVKRRGGYSYTKEDTINTYGDARGRFGAANSLRDPSMDTQTRSGPFDHGFFFNSPMGPRGGDSPYMN